MEAQDHVLVDRLAAGDDDALSEVFDRHGGFVLGIARRVTGCMAMADDVVQEVFCALWQAPERFDPARGSLRAFLGVQAHRRAVDVVRRDTRRVAREDRCEQTLTADDEADGLVLSDVVRQAIDRLPADQRYVVELAFREGRTHREVAEVLGIPVGTVKSRLRLAQAKLGEWLAPLTLETA